jgi:hypothetical protein
MPNKRQLLQDLKGEKVTIYTVEKEFTGILRKLGTDFSVAWAGPSTFEIIRLQPKDIIDVKRLSTMPVIFVHNHFVF